MHARWIRRSDHVTRSAHARIHGVLEHLEQYGIVSYLPQQLVSRVPQVFLFYWNIMKRNQ